ncbi:SpoIIE family protein phosphatase [Desulfatibacillum aliphaticivorans]|uniref:SpoIIE family protein phosphatase n=1 Tax=Desulfatibacillum aliphaticivorans TaxID=218208 RepID=UPI0004279B7F|nr:SpoIIE family protein phosphatase [Desulfatibacillum aliphaticivorans]
MYKFKKINSRITAYLLVPVALLLLIMGWGGYLLASDHLQNLWAEAATLQLQRAAHQVDMRFDEPKALINLFAEASGKPGAWLTHKIILDQLRSQDGVVRADVSLSEGYLQEAGAASEMRGRMGRASVPGSRMERLSEMAIRRRGGIQVASPVFDTDESRKTVSLTSEFLDENDEPVGALEVVMEWSHLIQAVQAEGVWKAGRAILADNQGRILARNPSASMESLNETADPLELKTLEALKAKESGTLIYSEDPLQFSGFYKLREAPWTLVLIAPGEEVLAPILKSRNYYIAGATLEFFIILLLIRIVTTKTVASIKEVSDAAKKVSQGDYSPHLETKYRDEMGTLVRDFNTMVVQLEERARLKTSINLAMEVQQNLLPQDSVKFQGLDIAGTSVYCDETGGDYYDFIHFDSMGEQCMAVALGDVSDHGIPSALFMTTARALIRCRASLGGGPAAIVEDVNRLLCRDTQQSGAFMTLFYLELDAGKNKLTWVRAGHDPALLYDPASGAFEELGGKGLAVGVRCQWGYEENHSTAWGPGKIILLATDGIWEARNPRREQFGKERFRESIRRSAHLGPEGIIQAVLDDLTAFRQDAAIEDDITLVVIKDES